MVTADRKVKTALLSIISNTTLLIFIAAGMIIIEAFKKIFEPDKIEQSTIIIVVMIVSALINFVVSRKLYKVSQEEDSMALEADALHLKTDINT